MYSWLILGRPFATRGRRMHPAVGPGRDRLAQISHPSNLAERDPCTMRHVQHTRT